MRKFFVVALLVCGPLSVAAQEASPEPVRRPASWSLGAGAVFFSVFSATTFPSSLSVNVPAVNASLERRLSDRSWLTLGAAGAAIRSRNDEPIDAVDFTRNDQRALFVTAGIRRVMTPAAAPIDVSVLVEAQAGVANADQRIASGVLLETRQDLTTWLVGARAGIAVDRELTPGLFLRVATSLVDALYSHERIEVEGEPAREGSDFGVTAVIAPRLELRLEF